MQAVWITFILFAVLAIADAKPKKNKSDDSGSDEDLDFFDDDFFKTKSKEENSGISFPTLPGFGFNSRTNLFGDLFGNNRMIFGIDNGEDESSTEEQTENEGPAEGFEKEKVTSQSSSMTSYVSNGKRIEVKNSCRNGKCKLCIKNCTRRKCSPKKCYKGQYEQIMTKTECPVAVCGKDCSGFTTFTDGCPMCRCEGFSTREPCKGNEDCPSDVCQEGLCVYPGLSSGEQTDTDETEAEELPDVEEVEETDDAFTPPPPESKDEKENGKKKKIMIRKEFN